MVSPPGSFIMGEGISEHPVVLTNGFYLGKFEVTQEEYQKVMGNNPSTSKRKNYPYIMSRGMKPLTSVIGLIKSASSTVDGNFT